MMYDCEIFVNEVRFVDNMKLQKDNHIVYIFKQKYNNLEYMFYDCTLLTSINLSNFNTNNVTYMNSMFYNCSSLSSINLENFNTNNVTDIHSMFEGCSSLTSLNIDNFNCEKIKKIEQIKDMFKDCKSLKIENVSYKYLNIRNQLLIDLK